MRTWFLATTASALLTAFLVAPPASAQRVGGDEAPTLRHVALSTGGVGYFEYEAAVDGNAALPLHVRLDQVDDILKSIVIYDDVGTIGEISLPGRTPLREAFREVPFGPEALASPASLLEALRGAAIRVDGPRALSGQVLSVVQESTQVEAAGTVRTQHRVSVLTEDGIRQFILEEADVLEFTDARVQGQVTAALAALARHGERERRTLIAHIDGDGERQVRIGYVVGVPLWKSAYRLTLPPADATTAAPGSGEDGPVTADLQGWAVLENLSGEDWEDVSLTLLSGNPVTIRQALYDAYFVHRPEVPVEVFGRVLPRVDTGAVPAPPPMATAPARPMPPAEGEQSGIVGMLGTFSGGGMADMALEEAAPAGQARHAARVRAAESQALTAQVLFRLPEPVSVRSGDSLLVPFLTRNVPIERVSLYQPATHNRHPLASVLVDNDGETSLPPGVLTLYERQNGHDTVAYIGDARLNALPAGEQRLVSFAVDHAVTIDREHGDSRTIARGRIVDGLLELNYAERTRTTYTIQGAADADRVVILEHPRRQGWELVSPAAAEAGDTIVMTETEIRIRVPVPTGETVALEVVQERPRLERMQLLSLASGQISIYAEADRLSADIREALSELGDRMSEITAEEREMASLERELTDIDQDQGRIRRNLDSVPRDSDLYERFLDTLSDQEDRLTQLRRDIAAVRGSLEARRTDLAEFVREIELR